MNAAEHTNPDAATARRPHAALDRESRVRKALKIAALVGKQRFEGVRRALEIGCGSGLIASTLSSIGPPTMQVYAVDVTDSRVDVEGYAFQQVSGTQLPFDDGTFDLAISNHVIEHVGTIADQLAHLREAHRVLSEHGTMYLAVPNKWRLLEPHFHLPFLSWLPQSIADRYVRFAGRGSHYDCLPPSLGKARKLFAAAGFVATDVTVAAIRETIAIEFPKSAFLAAVTRRLPDWAFSAGMAVMPTYVFLLNKANASPAPSAGSNLGQ